MKIGKISQTVLKRTVFKQLHATRKEALIQLTVEEMCAAIDVEPSRQVVLTDTSYYGNEKNLGVFPIAKTINDLATRGACPIGVQINIQLPPYAYESRLSAMVKYMEQTCGQHGLQILSVKAEVNPMILSAIVHVTAIGTVEPGKILQSSMGKANQDIVLVNGIAAEGVLRILNEKEEELSRRFVPAFVQQIKGLYAHLHAVEEIKFAITRGASAIHQITSGGILAALWEIAEASGIGVEIELKKIAIKQEAIEVCEQYFINPYQLTSVGSVLLLVNQGEDLVNEMAAKGMQAVVIGRSTDHKERVIYMGIDKRFIDRPQPDELVKIFGKIEQKDGTADD